MWNFLKNWFAKPSVSPSQKGPGAISPGTPEEIAAKVQFNEIVSAVAPVKWLPLDPKKFPSWPGFNQDGSGSCVFSARALMASILYFLRTGTWLLFSPGWGYDHRSNKPESGMIGSDAGRIESQVGHLPYVLFPSDDLGDEEISAVTRFPWYDDVAKIFRTQDEDIVLPIRDIDTLASVMQITGKPINVWFRFTYAEWTSVPTIMTNDMTLGHSVVFPPIKNPGENVFGIYNGKKAFVIQDSWGPNATQFGMMRIITEDFFKSRNIYAEYKMRFKFDTSATKPKYTGTIISLQTCLRSIGLFPTNVALIESMGPITKKGLIQFQANDGLPQTGVIDAATSTVLYSQFG